MPTRHPSRIATLLLCCATCLASLAGIAPPPAAAQTNPAPPQFLRDLPELQGQISTGDSWAIGGGFLYWAQCNLVDSGGGYLRRWPLRGGRVVTMVRGSFCPSAMAADESGLYYWRGGNIIRGLPGPGGLLVQEVIAASAAPSEPIILDNGTSYWRDYLFWVANDTLHSAHRYEHSRLAAPEPLGGGARSLRFADDGYFYWFADGALRRALTVCLAFGGGLCIKELIAAENGDNYTEAARRGPLLGSSVSPLWTLGAAIRGIWCREQNLSRVCSPSDAYVSPLGNQVGPPASDGEFLFWLENRQSCTPGPFGNICSWTSNGRLMKWKLSQSLFAPSPFDTPQQVACQNCYATYTIGPPGPVTVHDGWVYFFTSNGPSRLRADAPPITANLAAAGLEVTQGVQNLANDVPLVADKPTFVRLYGRKLNGPNTLSVGALLHGTAANGAALPGSPLRPLNGGQDFTADNAAPDRGALAGSWLFQLPPAWAAAGNISLRPVVDPEQVWSDPDLSNNTLPARSFSFARKAPICIVTVPVRTHAPAARHDDPSLFRMADVVRQLMPTPDIWLYHQDSDVAQLEARIGIPPWKYEPYALPSDGEKILRSLWLRDAISDDPDKCDDAGAYTHYVGLVHAQTPTSTAAGENLGLGNTPGANLYIKLIAPGLLASTPQAWQVQRFNTLAHELAHNYGRRHVNCGGPGNPDMGFPYRDGSGTNCVIDDGMRGGAPIPAHERYYGFDGQSLAPIDPAGVSDFMGYDDPYWVSDYTWRGLMGAIDSGVALTAQVAQAGSVVYITGAVDPAARAGSLDYAWVFPAEALSQGMEKKLLERLAPRAAALQQADPPYRLRLRDGAGALLDERLVTLDELSDHATSTHSFGLTMPAPAGQVARIELVSGETLLASLEPQGGAPTLAILSPAGGETIDNALTLSWRAADPDPADRLLFTVQYSPDGGQSWRTMLTGFPNRSDGDTVTLSLKELSGLPASAGDGLIRVAASDGYNTTIATSAPFTVMNRAPQPYISAPGVAPLPAGQPALLQGGAMDAEDGGLPASALRWSLDGQPIGAGTQQRVEGLAPGSYTLGLTAHDTAGAETTVTSTLTVASLQIPRGGEPALDGACDDGAYAVAAQAPLPAYADGSRAYVRLLRGADALWACFIGMRRTSGGSPGSMAVLRADTSYGRAAQPQQSDYVFTLGEDAVALAYRGDGAGFTAIGPAGVRGQVSATATTWMAELRIDAGVLGGWGHPIGLGVEQVDVGAAGDNYLWPRGSAWNRPATWAAAILGDGATLDGIEPLAAPRGAGDTAVTLTGSGFVEGAMALLDGAPLPTTFVSATELQASLPAASLAAAGELRIAVANPGLAALPSSSARFEVRNPAPRIDRLALSGRTLIVTGADFAPGAAVVWDGAAHDATLVSETELRTTLAGEELATFAETEVTAFNPGPGGGVSNVATLAAEGAGATLYLPLLRR